MKKILWMTVLVTMVGGVLVPQVRADKDAIKKKMIAREYITACYQDMLGREPTQKEQDDWMVQLHQYDAKKVRKAIASSQECVNKIKQAFQQERGSEPTAQEIQKVQKALAKGKSLKQLRMKL